MDWPTLAPGFAIVIQEASFEDLIPLREAFFVLNKPVAKFTRSTQREVSIEHL